MHSFVRNFVTEWRRLDLPVGGETVVVAVSGGADSVSLLLALNELRATAKLDLRLVIAHFNHRLRDGESDADEEFVRQLASERRIEFAAGHAESLGTGNLEQNARVARYDFLKRTADSLNAFAVLTGHTINDQAETFLMNLIRGSGPEGLCGMKAVRPIDIGPPSPADGCETQERDADVNGPLLFPTSPLLVRPLLKWAKRGDTEGYCRAASVEYRYDTMNEDTAFKRVRIRKILLPLLEDMNPNIIETLSNTAGLMQEMSVNPEPRNRFPAGGELKISEIKTLSQPELYDAIRSWLRVQRGNTRQLELKHIRGIERLIFSVKSGKIAELPGGRVIKNGGRLVYNKNKVEN